MSVDIWKETAVYPASSQSIHCGPRKIWRVLFRQNMFCLESLLSNLLRDPLKRPTGMKTMNGEPVVNCRKQTKGRNNEEKQTEKIFWFFLLVRQKIFRMRFRWISVVNVADY